MFHGAGYFTDVNNVKCGFVTLNDLEGTTFFESKDPFEVILLSETNDS